MRAVVVGVDACITTLALALGTKEFTAPVPAELGAGAGLATAATMSSISLGVDTSVAALFATFAAGRGAGAARTELTIETGGITLATMPTIVVGVDACVPTLGKPGGTIELTLRIITEFTFLA